jgi:hypothetical protein
MKFAEEVQKEQERLNQLSSFVAPLKSPEGPQAAIRDFISPKFATAVSGGLSINNRGTRAEIP